MAKSKNKTKSTELADQLFPEIENEPEILNIPPEQRRLHTETYDYSVSTLIDYLEKDHIFIPEFQRGYVWSDQQASRLIESLIIQCPIPVIYMSQSKAEKLAIIDGNQRIRSIARFLRNEFELKGLTAYPELAGLKFFELDARIQRHIVNRTLRCIVILKETHPQVQFDVFERLNTGAKSLNPQELRHGLYYGPLMILLEKLGKLKEVKSLFPPRFSERMKAEELILRFIAIRNSFKTYSQPVSAFLNEFSKKNMEVEQNRINEFEKQFLDAIESARSLFGNDLLFRPPKSSDLKQSFYVALFDAQLIAISEVDSESFTHALKNKESTINKYKKLFDDEDFVKSITKATPNKSNVTSRINKVKEILE